MLMRLEPGATFAEHAQPVAEEGVIIEGVMEGVVDGQLRRLGPGDHMVTAAGGAHPAFLATGPVLMFVREG